MSKKKTILILILLGILAIVVGGVLLFIADLKKDQQEMNSRMSKISSNYQEFKSGIEKINEKRDTLHKEFLDTVYYDSFYEDEKKYRTTLYNYEKELTNLSKDNEKLKEYCKVGIYYSSSDINSKCSAFNLAYEQLVNTFVDDVAQYNSNIGEYNKWLKEQNNNLDKQTKTYETKKTYIDYNQDGEYSGKDDRDEEK